MVEEILARSKIRSKRAGRGDIRVDIVWRPMLGMEASKDVQKMRCIDRSDICVLCRSLNAITCAFFPFVINT
jgi:hypothetical protein